MEKEWGIALESRRFLARKGRGPCTLQKTGKKGERMQGQKKKKKQKIATEGARETTLLTEKQREIKGLRGGVA